MKSCSAELLDLLTTSRKFFSTDLYTLTLLDGTVLRYTTADADLRYGGDLYLGTYAPLFERTGTRLVRGIEVDTLRVTIDAKASHTINGVPWLQALANQVLDGARLKLHRGFGAEADGQIVGTILLFSGRVSETQAGTTHGDLTVRSDLELLNIRMPRNLYQPGCLNILFDSGCGKNKAAYAANAVVAPGSSRSVLLCNLTQEDGYFALGEIIVTSGQNAGVRRAVREYSVGSLSLSYPLPKPIAVGDTLTAWPGCNGQRDICEGRFGNLPRYRAFPYVPTPEAAA